MDTSNVEDDEHIKFDELENDPEEEDVDNHPIMSLKQTRRC